MCILCCIFFILFLLVFEKKEIILLDSFVSFFFLFSFLFFPLQTPSKDPMLRAKLWKHLVSLASTTGITIVITTHYIEEARQANVVGMMRHGRLLTQGAPDDLLRQYQRTTLEDVFLDLCMRQEVQRGRKLRDGAAFGDEDEEDDDDDDEGSDDGDDVVMGVDMEAQLQASASPTAAKTTTTATTTTTTTSASASASAANGKNGTSNKSKKAKKSSTKKKAPTGSSMDDDEVSMEDIEFSNSSNMSERTPLLSAAVGTPRIQHHTTTSAINNDDDVSNNNDLYTNNNNNNRNKQWQPSLFRDMQWPSLVITLALMWKTITRMR